MRYEITLGKGLRKIKFWGDQLGTETDVGNVFIGVCVPLEDGLIILGHALDKCGGYVLKMTVRVLDSLLE